jgi:hypothetical protein
VSLLKHTLGNSTLKQLTFVQVLRLLGKDSDEYTQRDDVDQ